MLSFSIGSCSAEGKVPDEGREGGKGDEEDFGQRDQSAERTTVKNEPERTINQGVDERERT
jgi:hypothetical protein